MYGAGCISLRINLLAPVLSGLDKDGLAPDVLLFTGVFGIPMEAAPISNATTASTPPQASPAASGGNRAADANGLPAFAQVVLDVLNRTMTSSSDAQPAASSRGSVTPKTTGPKEDAPQSGKDEAHLADSSSTAILFNLVLLPNLLVSLPTLSLDTQRAGDGALSGNPVVRDGGAPAGVAAVGTAIEGNGAGSVAATLSPDSKGGGSPAQNIAAVLAPEIAAQLSTASSVPTLPTVAPAEPAGAPAASGIVPVSPQPASDAASAPVTSPQTKVSVVQAPELAPPAASAQPLASLLPQISQLPDGAAGAHVPAPAVVNAPAQGAPHTQPEQASGLARASLQFTGARPAVLSVSAAAPKGLQPVIAEARTAAPVQGSSSSSEHAAPQDAGSDRKEPGHGDAPTSTETSSTAPASHDATSFSGSLAAANVKQDASQAPATAPAAMTSAPVATSDRGVSSSGGTPQAAPAPAPSSLPPFQGTEAGASRFVNNAQLVEAAGHSEMRIAMDTDKLGAVELRAHMVGDEVGAAITVEKRDAHAVLAVELPALQQALSDKQLRIEHVTLLHGSFSSTAGDAGASTRHEERSTPHATTAHWPVHTGGMSSMFASAEQSGIFDSHGRLSVHA